MGNGTVSLVLLTGKGRLDGIGTSLVAYLGCARSPPDQTCLFTCPQPPSRQSWALTPLPPLPPPSICPSVPHPLTLSRSLLLLLSLYHERESDQPVLCCSAVRKVARAPVTYGCCSCQGGAGVAGVGSCASHFLSKQPQAGCQAVSAAVGKDTADCHL